MSAKPRYIMMVAALLLASLAFAGRHVVQANESLASIAKHYGLDYVELAYANRILDVDYIQAGQTLTIPERAVVVPDNERAAYISKWSPKAYERARKVYDPPADHNLPSIAMLDSRHEQRRVIQATAPVNPLQTGRLSELITPLPPPLQVPDPPPGLNFPVPSPEDLAAGLRSGKFFFVRSERLGIPVLSLQSDRGTHGVISACSATLLFTVTVKATATSTVNVTSSAAGAPVQQRLILSTFVQDMLQRSGKTGTVWPSGGT
jgi:LysM repeat protein